MSFYDAVLGHLPVVFFCAAQEALTLAQGFPVAVEVGVVVGVVGVEVVEVPGAMHEQALEILKGIGAFKLSLQPSAAKDGMAVGAIVPVALV